MDPRLLNYYNRELQFIREMGGEFAREFPKIAGRLGMEGLECADPYVERLLEGFSFLAARVQLKIDDEFPRFTQHLLEMVYPHYLAPTPSMAVVQFQPETAEGGLAGGFPIPRDSVLASLVANGEQTPCEYRTCHDVSVFPLEITRVEYIATSIGLPVSDHAGLQGAKAGIRLHLRTLGGVTFDKLTLAQLPLFLRGTGSQPARLYEQLLGNALGVVVRAPEGRGGWSTVLDKSCLSRYGFEDDQAMLPYGQRSFQGYRLVQEYFAFPERYQFVELSGLAPVCGRCRDTELEIFILLDRCDRQLENVLDADSLALFCTPAINLFPKRTDRIHINERESEFHVVPDRTRPMDFEVYAVTGLTGISIRNDEEREYQPLYAGSDGEQRGGSHAYYTVHRQPRLISSGQRARGTRSSYVGTELFIALVDENEAPYNHDLHQLAIQTLCTNRDLPLQMPLGKGESDFAAVAGAPVQSIRCVAGPTSPKPPLARGNMTWQLISHLSLNYLSMVDSDPQQGAAALREMLGLYGDRSEAHVRKQIEGIRSISANPITRRLPLPGPITFGRGLEITLICDESAFEGAGAFILGAVLEQFFARYVSINSFTETVIRTTERGEIMRWPARIGRQPML